MKFIVLAAIAFAGFSVSALACDLQREASKEPTVVAEGPAPAQNPTATEQDALKTGQPNQERAKEESWPVFTVADCGSGNCK